jgi:hypothetical protein
LGCTIGKELWKQDLVWENYSLPALSAGGVPMYQKIDQENGGES